MKPAFGQVALAALALGAISLIGYATGSPSVEAQGAEATAATPGPMTVARSPSAAENTENEKASIVSRSPDTTATTRAPDRPRDLSVVVYPSDVDATVTITDAEGGVATGSGSVEARMAGEVTLEATAEGWRSENLLMPAEASGRIEVFLDPPDQVVDRQMVFTTGSAPKQVTFTPDGEELWVTLLAGTGLEIYDPANGELLEALDLPEAGSVEVIFDRAGATAWVSQMETATVYEVDVAERKVVRSLETGGSWTKVMTLSPDESRLWASNWVSNDISEFDLATGSLTRRFSTVNTPRGLALNAEGTRLYVAGYDAGEIAVVDLSSGESRVIHDTGGAMRHLVADPATGLIYASDMARDVILVIDTDTDEVSELTGTDRLPNTIDITPDGRILAVSNRGRNNPESYHLPGPEWGSIILLDTATGERLDAIVGGNQPTGLDISDDGSWLAYSDFLDNRVTVVSLPGTDELLSGGGGRANSYQAEITK